MNYSPVNIVCGYPNQRKLLPVGGSRIHGVWVIPLTMHLRISILRPDNTFENIEADQSFFISEVNQIDRRNFDRQLANIASCVPSEEPFDLQGDTFQFIKLHPTHGFILKFVNIVAQKMPERANT